MKKKKEPKCFRCGIHKSRGQVAVGSAGAFDVWKAEAIIAEKPRRRRWLTIRETGAFLGGKEKSALVSKRHLPHVDMTKPGIVGQTETLEFLLDGRHRGFNHWSARKRFPVYVLSEFETGRCYRKPPNPKAFKLIAGKR